MRAPLSWIRDFTRAEAPLDELVAALNQLGLEVEGVEEPGKEVVGVRVARILEVLPHPDADRLQLADVEYGDGTTRVVCGASNIAAGMVVPYAGVGAELPGGLTLERRKIRGQVSEGMILSRETGRRGRPGGMSTRSRAVRWQDRHQAGAGA
jgi:phenylalanyl-tRNA synthetase beta chain